MLATCVVVDESRCLDTLTWVQADTASAVCGLTLTPITFAAVICNADGPCLVNVAYEPESTFTMPHWSTTGPLYYRNLGSNSEFLRWHMSLLSVAKRTVLPSFCASSMTSSFVPDFRHLPCWQFVALLPLLVHSGLSIRYFHCWMHGKKLMHKIVVTQSIESLSCNAIFMIFCFHAMTWCS